MIPSPDSPSRRDMALQELGCQFALISEEAACSCWAWRIEDELPPLLAAAAASGRPASYRGVESSAVYAEWLVTLADQLGHWVIPGPGAAYAPYTPAPGPSAAGGTPDGFAGDTDPAT